MFANIELNVPIRLISTRVQGSFLKLSLPVGMIITFISSEEPVFF